MANSTQKEKGPFYKNIAVSIWHQILYFCWRLSSKKRNKLILFIKQEQQFSNGCPVRFVLQKRQILLLTLGDS